MTARQIIDSYVETVTGMTPMNRAIGQLKSSMARLAEVTATRYDWINSNYERK